MASRAGNLGPRHAAVVSSRGDRQGRCDNAKRQQIASEAVQGASGQYGTQIFHCALSTETPAQAVRRLPKAEDANPM